MRRVIGLVLAACSATSPMEAGPIAATTGVPASGCAGEPACRAGCDQADANACARLGDLVYRRDRGAARELYRRACDRRDPIGCARMAEEAGGDRAAADRYLRRACAAGHPVSCAFVSEASYLAFLAPRRGEDGGALFALSEQSSRRACELGSYSSCANAAGLLERREAPASEIAEVERRGLELAGAGCSKGELGACGFVAGRAAAAGEAETARRFYRAECRLARAATDTPAMEIDACKRAAGEGGNMALVLAATEPDPAAAAERAVPPRTLETERVEGATRIQPSDRERAVMRDIGGRQVAIFKLCLSARGGVHSIAVLDDSPLPGWNRALFEAMRAWRYRPYRVDGEPVPVCTSVTFVYLPR